jgi:hypothetical protein
MFNFFRRLTAKEQKFRVVARYYRGDWFRQFSVEATSAYAACRAFDQSENFQNWIRVSNATLEN